MIFEYFDMLSGDPIPVEGIGTMRSPKLRDLCPSSGVGYKVYNLYLNFLSWDKEQLLKYDDIMHFRGSNKLHHNALNMFDVVTLLKQTRELCRAALSFFILEKMVWDETQRRFIVFNESDGVTKIIGEINRDNFEEVRQMMLQMNYIGLDKSKNPATFSDEQSKKYWDRVQKHLKEQAEKRVQKDKPEYHLSNIISKLCASHPSYNILNIYELTVFQLYDAFFQFGYIRSSNLNERIFTNHGGKQFKFEDWLKPILNEI